MKSRKFILPKVAAVMVSLVFTVRADDTVASPEGTSEVAGKKEAVSSNDDASSGFERYRSIIDRHPFGVPPEGFDPSLPVGQAKGGAAGDGERTAEEKSAEEQKMMSSVRVSVLNVTPAGVVMVGFTDSSIQPPANYYMKVGDVSTDTAKWKVKSADPSTGDVTLTKDGIDITLAVGDETKKGAAVPKPAITMNKRGDGFMQTRGRSRGLLQGNNLETAAAKTQDEDNPLARLRRRRQAKRAAELAEKQAAEKERAEIKAREEAIRQQEREQAAAEREQQMAALQEIQEELRRNREEAAAIKASAEAAKTMEE